jgi:hypothetical protein
MYTIGFDGVIADTSAPVTVPAGSAGYAITQNPTDSGFAVVFSGPSASVTLLDKHLNILQQGIPFTGSKDSRNPSAAFRNDSLFIVWEDYRNGAPDIYGSALKVATSLSVEPPQERAAAHRITSVIPNPANGSAAIELSSTGGTIEVIDSYGELRLRVPVASQRAVIDTRGLPSGMYRIVLRGDRLWDVKALVVMR